MQLNPDTHFFALGKLTDTSSRVGLAFHQIRPIATDASGNKIYPTEDQLRSREGSKYGFRLWSKADAELAMDNWVRIDGCHGWFLPESVQTLTDQVNATLDVLIAKQSKYGDAKLKAISDTMGEEMMKIVLKNITGVDELLTKNHAVMAKDIKTMSGKAFKEKFGGGLTKR